jgi:urease accessory protein
MPLPTQADIAWSELEVADVRGRSQLITCKNLQPLKILNPAAQHGACHAVLSSYGGGIVSGDQIRLRINAQAGTRLFISSQSNTKIFKAIGDAVAEQVIDGTLADDALAAVFPDPVVLQEGSRYRQTQHWHISPKSLLIVADWFHSGRMDIGERFVFDSFMSELRVTVADKLTVLDRFTFRPEDAIATSPANFGPYQTMLSVYLIGNPTDNRFQQLSEKLVALKKQTAAEPNTDVTADAYLLSVTKARENVYIARALAESRMALQPFCEALLQTLAAEELFGYNPLKRKY